MKALLIIDIQNDFIPGGALAVPAGDQIVPIVNELQQKFDLVVATQDWHPQSHKSFASNHSGKKPFEVIDLNGMEQVLWPDHCMQGAVGAEFPASLETAKIEAIFRKGTNPEIDSYSGFFDNGHLKTTGLADYLRGKDVKEVFLVGLAGDYCVYYSAKDALVEGLGTCLVEDAVRALDKEQFEKVKKDISSRGGRIVKSNEI